MDKHSNLAPRAAPCYRDIKLDNTLLDGSWPPRLRLCDFQFAHRGARPGALAIRSNLHLG